MVRASWHIVNRSHNLARAELRPKPSRAAPRDPASERVAIERAERAAEVLASLKELLKECCGIKSNALAELRRQPDRPIVPANIGSMMCADQNQATHFESAATTVWVTQSVSGSAFSTKVSFPVARVSVQW